MKNNIFRTLCATLSRVMAVAAVLLLGSCGQRSTEPTEEVPEGILRIFADRTTIAADGSEMVTFRVMFGSQDVSTARTMQLVSTYEGEDELYMPYGKNEFTTTTPGHYTFKAKYFYEKTNWSDNEISVEVTPLAEAGEQMDYVTLPVAFQFTSVDCTNCPPCSKNLALAAEQRDFITLAFHGDYGNDPMHITLADDYHSLVNANGYPSMNFNLIKGRMFSHRTVSSIVEGVDYVVDNHAATCGVAIETELNEATNELTVISKITSNVGIAYRYQVLLLEDGIDYYQLGLDGGTTEYLHNNVVRGALSSDLFGSKMNNGRPLAAGVEFSATNKVTLGDGLVADNMRVVVLALTSHDGSYVVNNANVCAVGQSVDYLISEAE